MLVVEQELERGIVIRLYERPAGPVEPARESRGGERLARYVGALRVEIAGPLSPDSLSQLLNSVQ